MIWLDIVVVIVCVAACIRGYMTGFVLQLSFLLGIILGAVFAGEMAKKIAPYLENIIGEPEYLAAPISYVIGFVIILIAVNLIGRIVNSLVKVVLLGTVNRLVGAVFCLGKWILIMSILLNLLVTFDHNKTIIKEEVREQSNVYSSLIEIAQIIIPYLRFDDFIPSDFDKTIDLPSTTTV